LGVTIWQKKSRNRVDFRLFILRLSFAYRSLIVRSRYRVGKGRDRRKVFNDTVSVLNLLNRFGEVSRDIACPDHDFLTLGRFAAGIRGIDPVEFVFLGHSHTIFEQGAFSIFDSDSHLGHLEIVHCPDKVYRTCMERIWNVYGTYMERAWNEP
jgi:hypothetical protein